jgi:hypothetical protein
MGPHREKGRVKGKPREGKLQKNREEIADLQKKIKTMIERRSGGGGANK